MWETKGRDRYGRTVTQRFVDGRCGADRDLIVVEDQCPRISGAMDNTDDNDLNVGKPVIERVITVEMRAQTLSEMIAAGTDFRIG
jgi:hypothetical protein